MITYMELMLMLMYIGMVGIIVWQQHKMYVMRRELGMLGFLLKEISEGNANIESNGKHFKLTRINKGE